ncbi:MAG: sulfur carrier protein ThiS [Mariprofundaceae bacterium]|nr:sulfur carrier protein ThiS [Mariprofundaceae bacterium]GMQ99391.1 MAG: sulfur carrier protein ThiS [Zetaproteobacteria bacterium]
MEIHLNGEQKQVTAANIAELLCELGMENRMIAIERNLEVVPKSKYNETALSNGDRIEVVHMIGGG